MAVVYLRTIAAYKVGAEGGDAACQNQVGIMYYNGQGVDVDHEQALTWIKKAAAQDLPNAVAELGWMYGNGRGVAPSWRRAREQYERAIELGSPKGVWNMQTLTENIQTVTNERAKPQSPAELVRNIHPIPFPTHSLPPPLSTPTARPPFGQAG